MAGEFNGGRCPRCGAATLADGGSVWCSYIGSGPDNTGACSWPFGEAPPAPRDPRIDPRAGDVLRWVVDGGVVVGMVQACTGDAVRVGHVAEDEVWDGGYARPDWGDWSTVDGGIDGVQVLYRAEVSDAG